MTVTNSPDTSEESAAITSLDTQIEKFNADTIDSEMGIVPIRQRVEHIAHDSALDQVMCSDNDGVTFLVLKRETDGRFKGTMEVEFHQPACSGPDGGHSWGHVVAEFYLEKTTF